MAALAAEHAPLLSRPSKPLLPSVSQSMATRAHVICNSLGLGWFPNGLKGKR